MCFFDFQMGVSKNNGTSKSSILIGVSIINHPFWGPLFLETSKWCFSMWKTLFFPKTNRFLACVPVNQKKPPRLLPSQAFSVEKFQSDLQVLVLPGSIAVGPRYVLGAICLLESHSINNQFSRKNCWIRCIGRVCVCVWMTKFSVSWCLLLPDTF